MKVKINPEFDGKLMPHVPGPFVGGEIVDVSDEIGQAMVDQGIGKKVTTAAAARAAKKDTEE